MALQAIALGGTCTGEHGIGVGKKEYLIAEMGQNTVNLMKLIKSTVDPENILNPGKIIDVGVPANAQDKQNDSTTCTCGKK